MGKSEFRKQQEASLNDLLCSIAEEEQQKSGERTTAKIAKTAAQTWFFVKEFERISEKVFKNKIVPQKLNFKTKPNVKNRILNLLLSDLHIGSDLSELEVPIKFGKIEEARRLGKICKETASYKPQYRENTELYVHLLGDLIDGQLHENSGAPLAEQVIRAIYLLTQSIAYLAQNFNKVTIFCATGNHSRITSINPDRAIFQKWNSFATIIYFSIKNALANCKNVEFIIPKTPYYTYKAFNQWGFATHGDQTLKIGYPNKNINIASIRNQINEINAVQGKRGEEYSLFMVGHVHTGSISHLSNGSVFITNSCLIPSDSFAVSIGILETACGQWLWESVPDHIVGDTRFLSLTEKDDKNKDLDQIIKPFVSF